MAQNNTRTCINGTRDCDNTHDNGILILGGVDVFNRCYTTPKVSSYRTSGEKTRSDYSDAGIFG